MNEIRNDVLLLIDRPHIACHATGSIFAYGMTSSGKTWTMKGSDNEPGILPLGLNQIFSQIREVLSSCNLDPIVNSCMEID